MITKKQEIHEFYQQIAFKSNDDVYNIHLTLDKISNDKLSDYS
jgi:hypothetical protein